VHGVAVEPDDGAGRQSHRCGLLVEQADVCVECAELALALVCLEVPVLVGARNQPETAVLLGSVVEVDHQGDDALEVLGAIRPIRALLVPGKGRAARPLHVQLVAEQAELGAAGDVGARLPDAGIVHQGRDACIEMEGGLHRPHRPQIVAPLPLDRAAEDFLVLLVVELHDVVFAETIGFGEHLLVDVLDRPAQLLDLVGIEDVTADEVAMGLVVGELRLCGLVHGCSVRMGAKIRGGRTLARARGQGDRRAGEGAGEGLVRGW
jgi:hypothetical protein